MLNAKPCRTCALRATDQSGMNFCQLTRQPISLDKDFCSKHQSTLEQCDICHQYLAGLPVTVYENEGQTELKFCCTGCAKRI